MIKSKLASDEIGLILADVFDDLNSDIPISAVDRCLDNFDDVCQPLFEKSCTNTATKSPSFVYNHESEIKKIHFFHKLNKYRRNKSDVNRIEMVRVRPV